MNNLGMIRKLANIKKKEIAALINATAHKYYAYEQERINMPEEIRHIIAMMYGINLYDIFRDDKVISESSMNVLNNLSKMNEQERLKTLIFNLTGEYKNKVTYEEIEEILNNIRNSK